MAPLPYAEAYKNNNNKKKKRTNTYYLDQQVTVVVSNHQWSMFNGHGRSRWWSIWLLKNELQSELLEFVSVCGLSLPVICEWFMIGDKSGELNNTTSVIS